MTDKNSLIVEIKEKYKLEINDLWDLYDLFMEKGKIVYRFSWEFYNGTPASNGCCCFYRLGDYIIFLSDDFGGDGPYRISEFWRIFWEKECCRWISCADEMYVETMLPVDRILKNWHIEKNGCTLWINDKKYMTINGELRKVRDRQ
ncbi:hypothetical protein [Hydrogenimonas cancrithermarum]|uniref:Uncharacterized protein n=1 Tax=Hydrogenimonas cancrithermarum TaxID=2993563 RepID=A0ABM8FNS5_9BACT|nr:hypothetical protein [Hydrogenimonas cancrithermarum]BDY14017.1 hypothetical protein HCR_23300 [Hydrogenimonas cancrithermarum]